jgi:hypothetical protein
VKRGRVAARVALVSVRAGTARPDHAR